MPHSDLDLQIIHLPSVEPKIKQLYQLLSEDEKEKANKFAFDHLTNAYIATRGHLRILLGNLISISPEKIRFGYGKFGKPYVVDPPFPLYFNVSHSGEYAVFAFSQVTEVGVDIEKIKPEILQDKLESIVFSKKELENYYNLVQEKKLKTFYIAWTQKEAILKANGKGIGEDLKLVETDLNSLPEAYHLTYLGKKYWLSSSIIANDYVVSLALKIN